MPYEWADLDEADAPQDDFGDETEWENTWDWGLTDACGDYWLNPPHPRKEAAG